MKEKIQDFLCTNNNWKKFISAEPEQVNEAKILSINVTTFLPEGDLVYFDVSIIYTINGSGQKQGYESGIGVLDKKGEMKEVRNYIP